LAYQLGVRETLELYQELLRASFGPPKLDEAPAAAQKRQTSEFTYVEFLKGRLRQVPDSTVRELLNNERDATAPAHMRLVAVITQIIQRFRNGSNFSIDGHHDGLIQYLIICGILDERCADDLNHAARQLIFTLIGWTFMLYMPQPIFSDNVNLRIENIGLSCFEEIVQPLEVCEGSFLELVCGFGKVFPWKEYPRASPEHEQSDQLLTSNLNVCALSKQFNITIKWVTCFSAHLDFDSAKRQLSLFCLPSFCVLYECNASALEQ
jgi:hypothetical protein